MKLVQTTQPTNKPLTVDEAKEHLRILHDEEDSYIESLIDSATSLCEQITNRQLCEATFAVYHDSFKEQIKLPRPPLKEVLEVGYIDINGDTVLTNDYLLDEFETPSVVYITQPKATKDVKNSFWVKYKAGYDEVPEQIKLWIKMKVASWYENREVKQDDDSLIDHLLDSYRIVPV